MSVRLNRLLEDVLESEPDLGDEVDAVFRRADRLRRRRTQALVTAGVAAAAIIAMAGYALTSTLMPAEAEPAPAAATPGAIAAPSNVADPVLAVLAPLVDGKRMHIYPRPPERGNGWRQYSVVDRDGKPRGTVEVAVYAVADDLCFPVLAARGRCARAERAPAGIEYVRYDDDQDVDWQVHQTIARRTADGRTLAVMATGERGTDDASTGKPGLTGAQVEKAATDVRMFDAFGPDERCEGPSAAACPAFRVPVPDQTRADWTRD